jgi:peptide/nickel transport system substrate-binding protein
MKIIYEAGPGTPIGSPFDAAGATATSEQLAVEALFQENLDGSFTPCLATSMDIASDGSSITVHLRQGVKFSDGSDFNAQAVKWDYDLVKNDGFFSTVTDYWKSVDVIDNNTVKINYTKWQNTDIKSLGENWGFFVSPTAYQNNGIDWIRQHMVGTGPFMQTNYQQDVSLTTVRNPNYWQTGKPHLDGEQLLYVSDPLTRQALFESGGAQVLAVAAADQTIATLKNQGFNVIARPANPLVLVPDSANADSPWSNLKVRQALEYAIDKQSIVTGLGYGFKAVANQLPTSDSPAYDPSVVGKTYDVAKAKQLMADAGYPNGFKTQIIGAPTGVSRDIVIAIQAYMAAIGIQASPIFPLASAFNDYNAVSGWHNGILVTTGNQWPNYNSVWGFYFDQHSNFFRSVQKTDQLQSLINTSVNSIKPDVSLMQNVLNYIYAIELVVPIAYNEPAFVVQPSVQDVGFFSRMFYIYYRPADAWLSK